MANGNRSGQGTDMARRSAEGAVPLSQAMSRLFQDSFLLPSHVGMRGGWAGADGTNLWQDGDHFIVQLALPGMEPNSIACSVERNILTVTAESALVAPPGARPLWQTVGGQGQYQVQLPADVDNDRAEARYEAGILTVRLPKAQHARVKAIKVTTG